MKVAVLGAGVIGVTTAYELLRDGHEVVVVDRLDAAAKETSFANAGMVASGHAFAWASPRAPGILMRSLYNERMPLKFRLRLDAEMWAWSMKFLRECTAERARANTIRKHRLCVYSQQNLQRVVQATGLQYDATRSGLMYFFRSQESLDRGIANTQILIEHGQEVEVLDRQRMLEVEPALAMASDQIAGAVYCPTDETGDARLFTERLAAKCRQMGAEFRFGTELQRIETESGAVSKVITQKGELTADAFVLALGCQSTAIGRRIGVKLPVYPVKGYSVTFPLRDAERGPALGGVDEDNLVAYTRMGDRVRATSTAEFAGYDTTHAPKDFNVMTDAVRKLFPDAIDFEQPSYWAGLRPMTPDGSPRLGVTKYPNLFVNTGHGHMGWTMACGSARITADLMAGRKPDIDLSGMTLGTG